MSNSLLKLAVQVTLILGLAQPAVCQISFEGKSWIANGNIDTLTFKGKKALSLTRSASIEEVIAYCPDDTPFSSGVIEMDIASPHDAGINNYLGLVFRMNGMTSFENLYFRPHLSGAPNAIQYEPVYDLATDLNAFLRHRDPEFQKAAAIPANDWFHVKVIISGLSMEVYIDNETDPSMVRRPLLGINKSGFIGLKIYGGIPRTAYFSNIVVTPADTNICWQHFQQGVLPSTAYAGTDDAWINSSMPGLNYGSASGLSAGGNPDRAILFKWDISSILSNNLVTGAWVVLNCENNTTADVFSFYALKQEWQEAGVNWNETDLGQPWQSAGGQGTDDRGAAEVTQFINPVIAENNNLVNGSKTLELNQEGIQMVQDWANNPAANYGAIMQNYNDTASDEVTISASENATRWLRPKLIVEYDSTTTAMHIGAPSVRNHAALNISRITENGVTFTVNSNRTGQSTLSIFDIRGRLQWRRHAFTERMKNRNFTWDFNAQKKWGVNSLNAH